jgi:hypothetical protein
MENIEGNIDRTEPNPNYTDNGLSVPMGPIPQHGPSVRYDGTPVYEGVGPPPSPTDWSRDERQARMRQLANVFIELFGVLER